MGVDQSAKLLIEIINRICLYVQKTSPCLWSILDSCLLICVSLVRLKSGANVAKGIEKCNRPSQSLILYDAEADPECRLVRETLSTLDIDYICYPCPRETLVENIKPVNSRYRTELFELSGTLRIPFLIDPCKHVKLVTANDINKYLWKEYGNQATMPFEYKIAHNLTYCRISLFACQILRPCMYMGILRAPSYRPTKPLELWGYESSPFVRRVREILTMLELPYVVHPVAKKSLSRISFRINELDKLPQFKSKPPGIIQVPLLRDPNNNDLRLLESTDIIRYLTSKYQTFSVGRESWLQASDMNIVECTASTAVLLSIFGPPFLAIIYLIVGLFI